MTQIAFRPLTDIEQLFHDMIFMPMLKGGEVYIEGQLPFLALPVIKQLDEITIEALGNALFNQLVLIIDIAAIKLVDAAHNEAWVNASTSLMIVAEQKGKGSPEYEKQREVAEAALAKFLSFGGSDPK